MSDHVRERGRRRFLAGSMATAAWTAVATAVDRAPGSDGRGVDGGAAPSRRFLDAVIAGDLPAVRGALDADPGLVHLRDDAGRSGYALALVHRHSDVGELLRERGHSPDLHESALGLDWKRLAELAEKSPGLVNQDHPIGGTAMYAAAVGGALDEIWRVYSHGGDPNLAPRGTSGHTPVRAALDHPDLTTAEVTAASLLANGADPAGPDIEGSSALHAAAERGSLDLVEILIRKGAPIDARDVAGRTALELAELRGQEQAARLLREQAAIPRDHSTSRATYDAHGEPYVRPDVAALPVLAMSGLVGKAHTDLEAVRSAVEREPRLAHATGTTTEAAVEAGAHMGRLDIVDYLLEHGAAYSLPTAVVRNDLARARFLLEQDPLRIHERGPHDFALLWYPVIGNGLVEMARLLLSFGADVERQHSLGTTALHFAARAGQTEMAALLLEHGADPQRRPKRKLGGIAATPLELAEERGHADTLKLLREHASR